MERSFCVCSRGCYRYHITKRRSSLWKSTRLEQLNEIGKKYFQCAASMTILRFRILTVKALKISVYLFDFSMRNMRDVRDKFKITSKYHNLLTRFHAFVYVTLCSSMRDLVLCWNWMKRLYKASINKYCYIEVYSIWYANVVLLPRVRPNCGTKLQRLIR